MGGAMNTHEFITKQIDQQLQRDGFSGRVSHAVAGESLDYYLRTAQFKKGAMQGPSRIRQEAREGACEALRGEESVMNTRRTAIWLGSLFGGLLYLFILAAGPIWGGIITAEATHLSAAGR